MRIYTSKNCFHELTRSSYRDCFVLISVSVLFFFLGFCFFPQTSVEIFLRVVRVLVMAHMEQAASGSDVTVRRTVQCRSFNPTTSHVFMLTFTTANRLFCLIT